MGNQKKHKTELEQLAPLLSRIKKVKSFDIPENYFDEFPQKIQEKVLDLTNSKSGFYRFNLKKFVWASALAAFIIMACGIYFLTSITKKPHLAILSDLEIVAYIDSYEVEYMDEDLIVSFAAAENLEINKVELNEYEEEMIEFLIANDITTSDILTELDINQVYNL